MAKRRRDREQAFAMQEISEAEQERVLAEAQDYARAMQNNGWAFRDWFWEDMNLVVRMFTEVEQQSQEALKDDAPPGWNAQTSQVRTTAEAAALNRIEGLLAGIKGILESLRGTTLADMVGVAPVVSRVFSEDIQPAKDKTITGELVAIGAGPRNWDSL